MLFPSTSLWEPWVSEETFGPSQAALQLLLLQGSLLLMSQDTPDGLGLPCMLILVASHRRLRGRWPLQRVLLCQRSGDDDLLMLPQILGLFPR